MTPQLKQRLISVADYAKMTASGILAEHERIELIDGKIFQMSPIDPQHALIINRIAKLLFTHLDENQADISIQNPIQIPQFSQPEPDIALIKTEQNRNTEQHPQPSDVFLIIEVANTSYKVEKEIKLPLYAKAGIPEYWIVRTDKQEIETYHSPSENDYEAKELIRPEDTLTIQSLHIQLPASKVFF